MIERRKFLIGAGTAVTTSVILSDSLLNKAAAQSTAGYQAFLKQTYQQAVQQGFNASIMKQALDWSVPNAKVIQLDRKQPEFTMTWAQYYQKVISPTKISQGKSFYHSLQTVLSKIWSQYQVDPRIVLGIWGIESAYGKHTGKFNVIDSLATLAFEGRRAKFFKSELMKALKILDNCDIAPAQMLGSYAGAMGQPQFMPSAYLQYAVDFSGTGQRNIWTNVPDVLASIANYLAKCGWKASEPWGQEVTIQGNLSQTQIGRKNVKTLSQWQALGVRRKNGSNFSSGSVQGAVIRPDGEGGQAFMVYHNFNVIRRYNPSDYYALAVGLLGDAVG